MTVEHQEFFADTVHKHIIYSDPEAALKKYRIRILTELALRGLDESFIKDKVILDVGTGFQALIFASLGARYVYHVDCSGYQIEWLKHYSKKHGIDNIESIQADITDEMPLFDPVDLVVLFGVYHHLKTPGIVFTKMAPFVENTDIWLRIYRSGTWSRWLVSWLRIQAQKIRPDSLERWLMVRFPFHAQWRGDLLDDLFCPVWQAFHPKQFAIENLATFIAYQDWDWNFGDQDENFRVDLKISNATLDLFRQQNFPDQGIDQMALTADENCTLLTEVHDLFSQWLKLEMDEDILANQMISLYEMVRKKTFDLYFLSESTQIKTAHQELHQSRLKHLARLLENFIKEK